MAHGAECASPPPLAGDAYFGLECEGWVRRPHRSLLLGDGKC
ncbi:MAG: hypothetical protein E6G75_25210 [Alphaproteobacteria bacterium]|nr:MAG: hypothetical protein E6G75_25210 [Alphaproteobacteria bacterium]